MSDPEIVRCPECITEGTTSKVFFGAASSTAMGYMPYADELGRVHHHDPNRVSQQCGCSRGHSFVYSTPNRCWCGWSQEAKPVATELSIPSGYTLTELDAFADRLEAERHPTTAKVVRELIAMVRDREPAAPAHGLHANRPRN